MTTLTEFKRHCREMAQSEHKLDCPSLTAVEPYWPPGGWAPIDADGNWTHERGIPAGLGWLGPKPAWSPPYCPGCLTDADRALFARLAGGEAPSTAAPDLFGGASEQGVAS